MVPRALVSLGAYGGRASGLDGHLRVAAAVSEPATAGRVPPQYAAGELTLPVCRRALLTFLGELVVVLVLDLVVVDDPQDLDEAEGGSQPPQGRRLVGGNLGHRPAG